MVTIIVIYRRPKGKVESVGRGASATPTRAELAMVSVVQDNINA
jgi:hypothetical protein